MKQPIKKVTIGAAIISAALIWGCGGNQPTSPAPAPASDNQLPADAKNLCPLPQATFNGWFAGGTPKENGFVLPANSITFVSNGTNCSFYQWSEQMFLWMASPASAGGYPGDKTVLESPVFYTVEPETNGERHFIAHAPGTPIRVMPSITQHGSNNLPIVHDVKGRAFELDTITAKKNKLHLLAATGNTVELARVEKTPAGLKFFDKSNKEVVNPKAVITGFKHPEHIVQRQIINGVPVFLTQNGPVDIEAGQAFNGDALMSQDGAMVYYVIFANDVYAWFQYAYVNKMMPDTTFPTDTISRNIISKVARQHGVTLLDSNALALEIKTSWIETKYVKNPDDYITIDAIIPEYNQSSTVWAPTGKEKTVKLAMVGMHIVGSTNKHPEMIWATYEYKKNTPNETYQYIDSSGNTKTQPRSDTKGWLFCNTPNQSLSQDSFNISHMSVNGGDSILANSPFAISASNSLLLYAFGSSALTPNPLVTSAAMSNSQVISSNVAIQTMLPGNDKRKNYILVGAEWTDGPFPNGNSYPADTSGNAAIGTSRLANSTMETTIQLGFGSDSANAGCFNCHNSSLNPSAAFDLSHIFSLLPNALPPVPPALKK